MLFGMPNLKGKKAELIRKGRTDIVARFMTKEFPFSGIRDELDVMFLLNAIDTSTEFKVNGKPVNIMQTLFPETYKQKDGNLKLIDLTKPLWNAFLSCESNNKNGAKGFSIGMQIFMDTLTEMFQDYSCFSDDGENYSGQPDLIKCIQEVDFEQMAALIS